VELGGFLAGAAEDISPFIELPGRSWRVTGRRFSGRSRSTPQDSRCHRSPAAQPREVHSRRGTITLSAPGTESAATISIIDSGCGIDEANLKRYGEASSPASTSRAIPPEPTSTAGVGWDWRKRREKIRRDARWKRERGERGWEGDDGDDDPARGV